MKVNCIISVPTWKIKIKNTCPKESPKLFFAPPICIQQWKQWKFSPKKCFQNKLTLSSITEKMSSGWHDLQLAYFAHSPSSRNMPTQRETLHLNEHVSDLSTVSFLITWPFNLYLSEGGSETIAVNLLQTLEDKNMKIKTKNDVIGCILWVSPFTSHICILT